MVTTTRYYFPSTTTAPAVTPAVSPTWNYSNGLYRRLITPKVSVESRYNLSITMSATGTGVGVSFVGDPLPARNWTGTLRFVMEVTRNANTSVRARLVVRVVSGDGLTVRGTLFSATGTDALTRPDRTARLFSGAITPVSVLAGDRLVVEVGGSTTSSGIFGADVFANTAAADLPFEFGTVGSLSLNPWIEFALDDPNPTKPFVGPNQITAAYVGSSAVSRIYKGDTRVY